MITMIDYTEIDEDTNCLNCVNNIEYKAGITFRVCGLRTEYGGLSACIFKIISDDWFCADFEKIEDDNDE
jgi:hypothetical protein